MIFHEAGIPPIHTPTAVLEKFPDAVKEKLYLLHTAERDLKKEQNLKVLKVGLKSSLILLNEEEINNNVTYSLIDLLCGVEIIKWVPFNRIMEIFQCFQEVHYKEGESIIKEKTYGTDFYIVKEGIIHIHLNEPGNKFSKFCYTGDYFGESSIIGKGYRLANVDAYTNVSLLKINKYDFKWIFNYQSEDFTKKASPMELISNLSEMRKTKQAEFINNNQVIQRMTESQKCYINMLLKEHAAKKGHILWDE